MQSDSLLTDVQQSHCFKSDIPQNGVHAHVDGNGTPTDSLHSSNKEVWGCYGSLILPLETPVAISMCNLEVAPDMEYYNVHWSPLCQTGGGKRSPLQNAFPANSPKLSDSRSEYLFSRAVTCFMYTWRFQTLFRGSLGERTPCTSEYGLARKLVVSIQRHAARQTAHVCTKTEHNNSQNLLALSVEDGGSPGWTCRS